MSKENILAVTAATYDQEVRKSDRPVVVDFWGTLCGPCKMIKPQFERLADLHGDRIKFVTVNVEENKDLVRELGIRSMPTFKVYDKGVVVHETVGAPLFGQLVGFLAILSERLKEEEVQTDETPSVPTDLQKVKTLFEELGIDFKESPRPDPHGIVLLLEAKSSDKVKGYNGFHSEYEFDKDGKFLHVGIWE